MRFTVGLNRKLGKQVAVASRPVGDSCPSTCRFLNNGCYAERTERIYPVARRFTLDNMITESNRIYSMLRHALEKGIYVRLGERGDMGKDDKVDKEYVQNLKSAIELCIDKHGEIPYIWAYTHFIDPYLVEHLSDYISLYASVHNDEDIAKAKKAGFKLFAYCSDVKYKRKGGNPKKVDGVQVCPNQINKDITCDKCGWCVKGRDNIVFLSH